MTFRLGHSFETRYHAAACDRGAYVEERCIYNCGESTILYESSVYAGHSLKLFSYSANCTNPQTYEDRCEACGFIRETWTEGDPLGHKWTETSLMLPSCTADGMNRKTCMVCGASKTVIVPASDHSWVKVSDTQQSCTVCGAVRTIN